MMKLLVFVFAFLAASEATSQSTIGLPAIGNFTSAGVGTWDNVQDNWGRLYFANDGGLSTYDGPHWQRYALLKRAAIRSLAIDEAGRVYVGGTDEIGFFSPGKEGVLRYNLLKEKLPVIAQQFADIWDIVLYRGGVLAGGVPRGAMGSTHAIGGAAAYHRNSSLKERQFPGYNLEEWPLLNGWCDIGAATGFVGKNS